MCATNVGKHSGQPQILKYMVEFTLRKNPMCATNVRKHSVQPMVVKHMIEFTWGNNPLYAANVGNLKVINLFPMKKFTQRRKRMYATNVKKH